MRKSAIAFPVALCLFLYPYLLCGQSNGEMVKQFDSIRVLAKHSLNLAHYDSVCYYSNILIQIADDSQNDSLKGMALNYLGIGYGYLNKYDSAVHCFKRSLFYLKDDGNALQKIPIHYNLALSLLTVGRYQDGLNQINIGFSLAKKIDNKKYTGKLKAALADFYFSMGNINLSKRYVKEAINISKIGGDSILLRASYRNLAEMEELEGNDDQALKNYLRAVEISELMRDTVAIGQFRKELGIFYFHKSEEKNGWEKDSLLNKALHHLKVAKQINDKYQHELEGHRINVMLGLVNVSLNKTVDVVGDCEAALSYAKTYDDHYLLGDVYMCLFMFYKKKGDIKKLIENYQLHKNYMDSIDSRRNVKLTQFLNQKSNYEHELAIKKQEAASEKKMHYQKQLRLKIVSVSISILLLISIGLYVQQRRISKSNKALVAQNLKFVKQQKKKRSGSTKSDSQRNDETKYESSYLTIEQKQSLADDLHQLILDNKLFMEPNLTLSYLATKMKVNSNYISQVVNEIYHKNFSTFINEFRVDEARVKLADPSFNYLTLESIAEDVGFSSKASFNRAFKNITGLTPSYFKRETQAVLKKESAKQDDQAV